MQKLVPRYKNGGNTSSLELEGLVTKHQNYAKFLPFRQKKGPIGGRTDAPGKTIALSPLVAGANLGIGAVNLGIGTWKGAKFLGEKLTDKELWDGDGVKAVWDGTKFVGRGIGAGAKGVWEGTKWLGGKVGEGAGKVAEFSTPHLPLIGNVVGNLLQAKYSLDALSKPVTVVTPPKIVNQNVAPLIAVDPNKSVFKEAFHTGKVRSSYSGSDILYDTFGKLAAAKEVAMRNQNQAAIEAQNKIEQEANQTRQQNLANQAAAETQRGALAALNENNRNKYLAEKEAAERETARQSAIAETKGNLMGSIFGAFSTHIGNIQDTKRAIQIGELARLGEDREKKQGYYNYYKSKLIEKSADGKLTPEQETSLSGYEEAYNKAETDYNKLNSEFRKRYFTGLGI